MTDRRDLWNFTFSLYMAWNRLRYRGKAHPLLFI